MKTSISDIIDRYGNDPSRLMDILLDIQEEFGFIPDEFNQKIADMIGISKAELVETISFYHFFSNKPLGKYNIFLNNSVTAEMMGREKVKQTFEEEAGIKFGHVSGDSLIGLFDTSCIGMCDQEPAAIINGVIFKELTPFRVKAIVKYMREGIPVREMCRQNYGDGNNSSDLVQAVVSNNIRR
jgi:[NiFe] hydrogenase diaphorase moiety large subunit